MSAKAPLPAEPDGSVLLLNSTEVPSRRITEVLGLVQGHTVFAIWLGKDLSALIRLILGGELTEYTEMMGKARTAATNRMVAGAKDRIIEVVLQGYLLNGKVLRPAKVKVGQGGKGGRD